MKVKTETLISELIELTRQNIKKVEQLSLEPISKLNWKPNQKSWSVLEAIEHLNLYGDFYLPKIESGINNNINSTISGSYFKPGLLGDYFAKSMLPKEKLNKMNTFKSKNPNGSDLNKSTLERFLLQQEKTLILLDKAKKVSLNKTKIPTTLGKLVKLNLGDTLKVVIYHNLRHIVQAEKTLNTNS
ncbi:DinB family protein [Thalassobellus citreus]|uniref:DinB family protein n=1 Tax=Thalassobellus citreus TaxID=3367752 RepID=UPI0037B0C2E7